MIDVLIINFTQARQQHQQLLLADALPVLIFKYLIGTSTESKPLWGKSYSLFFLITLKLLGPIHEQLSIIDQMIFQLYFRNTWYYFLAGITNIIQLKRYLETRRRECQESTEAMDLLIIAVEGAPPR